MMELSRWKVLIVALATALGLLFTLPNLLPAGALAALPGFLPRQTLHLGLDLQGGSSLLLEVDTNALMTERLTNMLEDVRTNLTSEQIPFTDLGQVNGGIQVRITNPSQIPAAQNVLRRALGTPLPGAAGGQEITIATQPDQRLRIAFVPEAFKAEAAKAVEQSIEIVRRRIDQLGTKEPAIERQGDDRIVVQVPGLSDPDRLIKLLGTTAKMTFQLVDQGANVAEAQKGIVPIGDELLYEDNPQKGQPPIPYVLEKRIMVSGDRLTDAQGTFDQQSGGAVVTFRFDSVGARQFGNATKDNVGRLFAIVLDNKVIEAPVIQTPILGGSGQITGGFTIQTANDLAVLLRAGALPAPLKPLERRTVGAELGADAIHAGKISTLAGLALVALFMFARYGMFGIFADVALTLNVILLLAVLTMLGATLTLPGIAGIVLTMGMAVDANVLIYERIREEYRNGRTIIASIDTGFRLAMATIVDANATHVIAAIILFELGSGPVRGFAVTLLIGIITSFFTAVMVTRLIVVRWYMTRKPKKLTL